MGSVTPVRNEVNAIENNMPPTSNFTNVLRYAGAGPALSDWLQHSGPGSCIVGDDDPSHPAMYMLVGSFGQGANTAAEYYDAWWDGETKTATFQVILYHMTTDTGYTISSSNPA